MQLLLDTHILLWWHRDDPLLPVRAGALVDDQNNRVFFSSMSVWEIALKSQLGKLKADVDEVLRTTLQNGFHPLPFTIYHAAAVGRLPTYHRDPFDRALIAQAQVEPLHLLTHDEFLAVYGEHVLLV